MVLAVAAAAVVVCWDKGRFSTQLFTNQDYGSCHLQFIALKVALGPIILPQVENNENHRETQEQF